jgi:hypothetical protein
MRRLRFTAVTRLAVIGVVAATPIAGTSIASAAAPMCQPWNQDQPGDGTLVAVAALPDCEVWAVGNLNQQTLAIHLYGQAWTQVPTPNPAGQGRANSLTSVAATGAGNALAVGTSFDGKATRSLIARWDGAVWTRVPSPDPGGPDRFTGLFGVAAISAKSAWAVGSYSNGKARQTLIAAWNGKSWNQVRSPDPGGAAHDSRLTGIAVVSPRDAWAAGYYQTAQAFRRTLILHWNGKSWTQVPSPDPGGPTHGNLLFGVAATSARNAWAVGYDTTTAGATTLVLHWDGKAWARVSSPNRATGPAPDIDQLQGVTATSARNAWAVGYYQLSGGGFYTLILHWDGTAWHWMRSPDPAGDNDFLVNVTASANSAWAVGGANYGLGESEQSLVLRWNGTAWQS